MKEASLLVAVDGIVRGVQVEDDLLGWPAAVSIQEQLDEQALDGTLVVADLVVARGLLDRRVLQPVAVDQLRCSTLPANGAQSLRRAWSLPASSAMTGSCRSWSWSTKSS